MPDAPARHTWTDPDIWLLALWSGLVMAMGESLLYFVRQAMGHAVYVSADIVWASTLIDTAVCVVAALAVLGVVRVFPRARAHAALPFAFLAFLNWTAITLHERIHVAALPIIAAGLATVTVDLAERVRGRTRRVARRTLPWLASIAVTACIAVPLGRRGLEARQISRLGDASPSAANVLVLLIDTFRADHSSAYGYARRTTPRIDGFAEGGVLFERAFSTSSYTLASHASLLTGLLPHEHGAEWVEPMKFWHCDCPILGDVLQKHGYVTAGFSSNPYWFTREYGFARGFHHFEDFFNTPADAAIRTTFGRAVEQVVLPRLGYLNIPGRKTARFVNERVLKWLTRREGRPFFAFVNYFDIHDPYLPPEPYGSRFAGHEVGGLVNWRITGLDPRLTEDEIHDEMDAYDGAITYVDEQIGSLLDSLDARGVLDNTLVIVTSDHGEAFGEHGLMLHGHSLYAQTTHVPLVIRGPGVPAGVREAAPVSNAAVPSTVMSLALGEGGFPGDPLIGSGTSARTPPQAELVKKPWGSDRFPAFHGAMQAVVDGKWHYIRHEVFGPQLFDLESDPAELTDLSDEPEYAERVRMMDGLIEAEWTGGHRPMAGGG